MSDAPVRIKPAGLFLILLVVAGLLGLAGFWWKDQLFPGPQPAVVKHDAPSAQPGGVPAAVPQGNVTEAPDTSGITTVKEYSFVPATVLPAVKGTSDYKPLAAADGLPVVPFPINVWAGWAPIVAANGGTAPNKESIFAKYGFLVDLKIVDSPADMIGAYAAGEFPVGWGTLDMLPLFIESLQKDSRAMPRVFQQVDWSNGGDGIVVRTAQVKTMADLRGKTIVLAENSPSHYFLLSMLVNAGLRPPGQSGGVQRPGDVTLRFTGDAFQAAAAFVQDPSIAACVTWAPDIYNISEKLPGTKLLVSTGTANKLIADVWFARADFARDHMEIVRGLARGIFDGMELMKTDAGRAATAKLMAAAYKIPEDDAKAMLGDAHSTNWAENREFFLNASNPANFERVWKNASNLYFGIGAIKSIVSFDSVMDFTVVKELGEVEPYRSSANEYVSTFGGLSVDSVAESEEILARVERIHFPPNSDNLRAVTSQGTPYDPNVESAVEEIGKLVGSFGNAQVLIEGHTDASMKGQVSPQLVQDLSRRRAEAVKKAVLEKFQIDEKQILVKGMGWDRPADSKIHARNRRVEVKVYPLER